MAYLTLKDDTRIFYKDWAPETRDRSSSITAGR